MYAVIKSGGKQHRVVEGETLRLEKLDIATGDNIDFEEVLMVGEGAEVKIGAPLVKGGKVTAEVVSHGRGDKVNIIKFRRRKHSRTQQGHRQWYKLKLLALTLVNPKRIKQWLTRKLVVVPVMVAIQRVNALVLKSMAARQLMQAAL